MQQPIAPTFMTPPAIEDLQSVQAKMTAAISSLYEAVAEAARLELSADTLRRLADLIESTQKKRDELLKECIRPEPRRDASASNLPSFYEDIPSEVREDFVRRLQSGVIRHGVPILERNRFIGFTRYTDH